MAHDDLAAFEAMCIERFGHDPARASMTFLGVESIEVLRFEPASGDWTYVTVGMSRHPMTGAAELTVAPDGPRAELLLRVRRSSERFADVWRQLALLAAAPSVEGVVYRPGMTVDLGTSLAPPSACTGGLIVESGLEPVHGASTVTDILSVIPATPTELAWCRVHGAAELQSRWADQSVDLLDLGRRAARLG